MQTTFPHIKLTAEKVNEQHLNKDLFELAFNTTINFLPNEYELPSGIFIKQNNNYLIQYPKNQRNKQPKLISWEIKSFIILLNICVLFSNNFKSSLLK